MSILDVRSRISDILQESEDVATIYAIGLVPNNWVGTLNNRSALAPVWYVDQHLAMKNSRKLLFQSHAATDPGVDKNGTVVMLIAQTPKSNLVAGSNGQFYLKRMSVKLVHMQANGSPVRRDLAGQQITSLHAVKPKVDIDAL